MHTVTHICWPKNNLTSFYVFFLEGCQTELAYSMRGFTKALYSKVKVFASTLMKFLLIKPIILYASLILSLIHQEFVIK